MIDELEKEKANLQRLIDEAVNEQEYLSAHFHSEALEQVNQRLFTLRNLDDERYDQLHSLELVIENMKMRMEKEPNDRSKSILSELIAQKEKELTELKQQPKKQKTSDTNHLRDNLDQFAKGKVRGLKITLSKADDVVVEIRNTKNGTRLTMPKIKKLESEYLLTEEGLSKLAGLGFLLNEKGDRATIILTESKSALTEKVMRLISIIVFEVFYFKQLGNDAAIELINRNKRQTGKS
ncbi:MAG: hypothetical protein ACOYW3_17325 [Bacteroidota bacterium]